MVKGRVEPYLCPHMRSLNIFPFPFLANNGGMIFFISLIISHIVNKILSHRPTTKCSLNREALEEVLKHESLVRAVCGAQCAAKPSSHRCPSRPLENLVRLGWLVRLDRLGPHGSSTKNNECGMICLFPWLSVTSSTKFCPIVPPRSALWHLLPLHPHHPRAPRGFLTNFVRSFSRLSSCPRQGWIFSKICTSRCRKAGSRRMF